jgi:hypothetical protein
MHLYYLSVLAIFKNETMNLKLWIDHYLWQGVDHFYLIDNGSNDNPLSVLQEYIDKGIVSYYFLPEQYKQVEHYRFVFDKANLKKETYWLVVCDLDEFFFGVDKRLKIKLRSFDNDVDYLLCNWKMFGSDGNIKHPDDIRKDIVYRAKDLHPNRKYIFKPQIVKDSSNVWIHELVDINVERRRIGNNLIQLNHYPIQSLEFFEKVKMTRGDVCTSTSDKVRDMKYFQDYDHREFRDDTLKNLIINTPKNYLTY